MFSWERIFEVLGLKQRSICQTLLQIGQLSVHNGILGSDSLTFGVVLPRTKGLMDRDARAVVGQGGRRGT